MTHITKNHADGNFAAQKWRVPISIVERAGAVKQSMFHNLSGSLFKSNGIGGLALRLMDMHSVSSCSLLLQNLGVHLRRLNRWTTVDSEGSSTRFFRSGDFSGTIAVSGHCIACRSLGCTSIFARQPKQ
jgi:hypothetical protein